MTSLKELEERFEAARGTVDGINWGIVQLLANRDQAVDSLGEVKLEMGLPPLQSDRFEEMLEGLKKLGKDLGVDPALITDVFTVIHEHSVARQNAARAE